jgi:3-hydroxyisobutyrate dehydrogenase-like beta-hydroxyacid dehydrogenase
MTRTDLPALTVGWLGTGHMGAALAARIGRAGMDLTVWNRTRSKAEPLVDAGAKVADEPVELADRDLVFTMVSTSADLEQVVERLLADPAKAPRILVDCSTVSTEASARVREVCQARGTAFLASPVSGNGKVVAAGKLSLVSSGPREAYDEVEPVLNLLGRHVTYVGDGENARLVKICHNIMLGVVAQNLAEITVLAEKGGVPRAAMLDFLNNSVMGSMFTTYKSPAYVNLDFTPTFTPVLLRKDLDLGLRAGDELGVPMPVTAAARETVQAAIAQGRTSEDFAVLIELQARNSGYEIVAEDVEVDDGLAPADGER